MKSGIYPHFGCPNYERLNIILVGNQCPYTLHVIQVEALENLYQILVIFIISLLHWIQYGEFCSVPHLLISSKRDMYH